MKIWLDDTRPAPDGFGLSFKTAWGMINWMKENPGKASFVSLDHDLGPQEECGCGYNVVCFIEEQVVTHNIKPPEYRVHSANPVGRDNMIRGMDAANRIWEGQNT